MNKLHKEFTEAEKKVINLWNDSNLFILDQIAEDCYLMNANGNLSYEECFGAVSNTFYKNLRYNLALPRKVIKYYTYYLLENINEEGEWYVGEKQNNGNIEFTKCCESLEDAFNSL